MKHVFASLLLLFACALASAATPIVLSSPGQLVVASLKAGESVTVSLPNVTSCVDFGVYEKTGSVPTAGIDIVGGGYVRAGVVRLTHLYGPVKTATITARAATGEFHVVYKSLVQSTCVKLASTQKASP